MSYTTDIKEEISKNIGSKSEMIAELSGYIRNNGHKTENNFQLTTENPIICERIEKQIESLYEVKVKKEIKDSLNFSKKDLFVLNIQEKQSFILEDIGYQDKEGNYLDVPPQYIVGANEEIRAYLKGVFLSSGSINDPKTSRYHMELLIESASEAVFVQKLLNLFDLNVKILTRDKGYMLYIKEADKISDYLKIIKASNAVLYFENQRIYRNKKNQANRLNNCEQANMDKVVATATAQLDDISIIEDNLGMSLLDDKTQEALEYRKKYPEASLKELSEIISIETGTPITKSGLNHRFRKIKELATRFKDLDKK
ncbi:MAG: DNA-binding protein WhiA [bacterium]|nr:DNA-binding protein WhiA [Mycoplasmatota bacterium]MDD6757314.1 DNA-binding protein WhiA [bacterium]MDY2908407.1 DNA-binding protein WhiA [Candidatus Faecimonas sp.]